jgi:hypothetical protein
MTAMCCRARIRLTNAAHGGEELTLSDPLTRCTRIGNV